MRNGIRSGLGFLIVLWGLSHFFTESFQALDSAATASLSTIEAAAVTSQLQFENP